MDRYTVELDRAAIRVQHGAEDPDQRRFARAIVADQPRDLPRDDIDRDIVECHHAAEALADIVSSQGRRRTVLLIESGDDFSVHHRSAWLATGRTRARPPPRPPPGHRR